MKNKMNNSNNRFYYDEQIKNFYYESYYQGFVKVKDKLEDTSLKSLLSLQTKANITDIAKMLEIKGYSKLGKDGVIDLVVNNINKNMDEIISSLTYKEFTFIETLLKKKINKHEFNVENLTMIASLSSLGILHKLSLENEYVMVIADDFKSPLKKALKNEEFMSKIQNCSAGVAYIDGVMAHYGIVFGADLYKLVAECNKNIFHEEDVDYYLNYMFRSYEAFTEANSFVHPFIFSPEDIISELRVRQTIPYNYENVDYFIALGSDYKTEFTEAVDVVRDIFINNKIKKELVDSVILELMYYIKNDLGTMSIVTLLENRGIDISDKGEGSKLVEAIAELYNNTHMWVLKGLTAKELEERRKVTIVKEKEPGRNEPCPCNSGKKYKKCCGKR